MTIQDAGSVGELIAAVATVGTLAYLALQIRQSNHSNQLVAIGRLAEGAEAWLGQIVRDEALYDIYRHGMNDFEKLSPEHRGRFEMLIVQLLRSVESGWFQAKWNLVDQAYWNGYLQSVKLIVGSQGGQIAFERNRHLLVPEFAETIDKMINGIESEAA